MTEGDDDPAGSTRSARRSALTGLLVVAAIWLMWWVAAEIAYAASHVDVAYGIVFLGGPIAVVATLVVLVGTTIRVVVRLGRHNRQG